MPRHSKEQCFGETRHMFEQRWTSKHVQQACAHFSAQPTPLRGTRSKVGRALSPRQSQSPQRPAVRDWRGPEPAAKTAEQRLGAESSRTRVRCGVRQTHAQSSRICDAACQALRGSVAGPGSDGCLRRGRASDPAGAEPGAGPSSPLRRWNRLPPFVGETGSDSVGVRTGMQGDSCAWVGPVHRV